VGYTAGVQNKNDGVSRRGFLAKTTIPAIAAASGIGVPQHVDAASPAAGTAAGPVTAHGPAPFRISLNVNGVAHELEVEPRVTLLDALRERLHLTGTKKGCGQGTCGACTVLVNGRRIDSCLTLAVMHQHDEITTIEGLAKGEELHPMQAAFLEHDGFQCGYCTPGQIMSAVGLLAEKRGLDEATIREQMSGNICRCGAYPNIVTAIQEAGKSA
jgi:xanthine dehydrogenase YagT iron-sulfur-binding subunit